MENSRYAPEYKDRQGDGPRATPTIAGELVFAFTGDGVLAAVNASDGKIRWSHNVVKQLGGKVADYGMASSPLVAGDLVIVTAGAPKACVAAYRATTGERAWTAGDDATGYSSPALLDVGGRQQTGRLHGQFGDWDRTARQDACCGATRTRPTTTATSRRRWRLTVTYSFHRARITAACC